MRPQPNYDDCSPQLAYDPSLVKPNHLTPEQQYRNEQDYRDQHGLTYVLFFYDMLKGVR